MSEKDRFIEWVASMEVVINNTQKEVPFLLGMSEKDIKIAKSYFQKLKSMYLETK